MAVIVIFFPIASDFLIPISDPSSATGARSQDGFTDSQPIESKSTFKGQFIPESNTLS